MDKKLLILFVMVLIISITPASAFNIQGFQNEGENVEHYSNSGFWYKLGHFYDFCKSIYKIGYYASEAAMELDSISKDADDTKLLANKNEMELNKRNNKRKIVLKYLADKKLENKKANTNNGHANVQDAVKFNTADHKVIGTDKNSNIVINSKTNLTTDTNKTSNQTVNGTNNTSIHNCTIEVLDTDAIETKQKLEEKGSPVKIGHIQNDQIKNNTIVQLVNTEGYIKYWLYTSTVTINNEKFAELYNGKDFVQIPLKHFKNCFSGIILEIIGTENDLTPTEIVKEIYDTKLKNLQDNINYHNDLLITANYLKCIGIALTMIIPIISILIAILTLTPEPIISKGTAIFLGILAIIFWLCAALTFAIGVYMEGISTTCKNDYINEKEDLTSYNM